MILVSAQKIFYILPDFFEHVGQLVTRFKLHESNISVLLSKGQRVLNGYDGVLGSMKNEGWLTKCGKWFVALRILQQLIADWHLASPGVMEDRHDLALQYRLHPCNLASSVLTSLLGIFVHEEARSAAAESAARQR